MPRGSIQGDVRDGLVLAQCLVSGSGQFRPQSLSRALDSVPLIFGLGPAKPPLWREFGSKAHDHPYGALPLGLLEQA